jgi:poly(3-hydroxybutyrate) depolymerase
MRPINNLLSKSMFKQAMQASVLVTSMALLAACGSDDDAAVVVPVPHEGLTISADVTAEFRADVTYGTDTRNVLDIFLPESATPTPLVIFVHGGGFFTGDKSSAYSTPDDINELLVAGVAFATINYSLLDVPGFNAATANDTDGINKSLSDVKEALQFLKHNAADFNIDPANVAMYGVSAGAVSSLWLAYSPDMIDVNAAADSIAGESTSLVAVGAIETQGSMDVVRWESILSPIGATLESVAPLTLSLMESVLAIPATAGEETPGTASIALIETPTVEMAALRASLDLPALMITAATVDNNKTPVFVSNTAVNFPDFYAASGALGAIAAKGAEFTALSATDVEAAAVAYGELEALGGAAEGAVQAGNVIGGLLHFPTHALEIFQTAANPGIAIPVVANIPTLATLDHPAITAGLELAGYPGGTLYTSLLTGAGMPPAAYNSEVTIIDFLLSKL